MPESSKQKALRRANWDSLSGRTKFIFSQSWRFVMTLIVPLIYLPIIILWKPKEHPKAPYGAYTVILMATYWILECIPLPITSLLPIILIPMFGISHSNTICSSYFNDTIMFLFGGCVMALAFEYSNLHTRIAFFVMKLMGAQASVLLLGMMVTCMILSCWMNNTSTTAMMVPIVFVIMDQYKKIMIPEDDPHEIAMSRRTLHQLGLEEDVNNVETNKNDVQQDTLALPSNEQHGIPPNNVADTISEPPINQIHHDHDKHKGVKVNFPEDTKLEDGNQDGTTNLGSAIGSSRSRMSAVTIGTVNSAYWEDVLENKREFLRNLEIMFMIGIAFASNIGGTGVITGTGTNLIATSALSDAKKAINRENVKNVENCTSPTNQYWDLDFTKWIVLNVLGMVVNVFLTWLFLAIYFQGLPSFIVMFWRHKILKKPMSPYEKNMIAERKQVYASIKSAIKIKFKELGPMKFQEAFILLLFIILVILWVFRSPLFLRGPPVKFDGTMYASYMNDFYKVHPECGKKGAKSKLKSTWGWARFFGDMCDDGFFRDTAATVLICILIFTLPKKTSYYRNILQGGLAEGLDDPLMPVKFVSANLPWGPFFLLGGGFAIASAIKESELKEVLSSALKASDELKQMSINVLLAVVLAGVAFVTTLASNTATAAIVSPVLLELAQTKGYPPLFLLVPPIVGASYAFCLPISTPPNAIVYDKANMKQLDMIIPGAFVTVICNVVLYLFTITYTKAILNVDSYDGSCNSISNGTDPNAMTLSSVIQKSLSFGLD